MDDNRHSAPALPRQPAHCQHHRHRRRILSTCYVVTWANVECRRYGNPPLLIIHRKGIKIHSVATWCGSVANVMPHHRYTCTFFPEGDLTTKTQIPPSPFDKVRLERVGFWSVALLCGLKEFSVAGIPVGKKQLRTHFSILYLHSNAPFLGQHGVLEVLRKLV